MKKNIFLKSIAMIFMIVLFSTSIVNAATEGTGTPLSKTEGTLVALGDSITVGYKLEDVQSESYVNKLAKALNKEPVNLAVNGTKSSELLEKLKKSENIKEIESADIITISIGGNNILSHFIDALNRGLPEGKTIDNAESDELYQSLIRILDGKEDEILTKEMSEGVKIFDEDFPQIIQEVKKQNPKAKITVQTISNPLKDVMMAENFSKLIDKFLVEINTKIIDEAKTGDYLVADIAKITENSDRMLISNVMSFDIHPSKYGHNIIFLANYYLLTKSYPNKINCNITNAKTNIDYNSGSIVPKVTITLDDGYELPYYVTVTRGDNTKDMYFFGDNKELQIPIEDCYGDISISGQAKLSKKNTETQNEVVPVNNNGLVAFNSVANNLSSNSPTDIKAIKSSDKDVTERLSGKDYKTGDRDNIFNITLNVATLFVCITLIYGVINKKRKLN